MHQGINKHQRNSKIIFWTALVIGALTVILANIVFWDHLVRLLHIPLLVSGLLLLFNAYYKDRILRRVQKYDRRHV